MQMSSSFDGFRLAYEHSGVGGRPVVLLHGWPGDHTDFRHVVSLLGDDVEVVVPDLRGFGRSDKHAVDPVAGYGAAAQADSVVALIDELGLERPVIAGYDVGSRVAQAVAKAHPEHVGGLVLSPPLPGVGRRILDPDAQRVFWYQSFHRLPLADSLIDGNRDAVRSYLRHFWDDWSGPSFTIGELDLEHLVDVYAVPGAFAASIGWYRAGAGTVATALAEQAPSPEDRIATPTAVLWPEHDSLFPREWSNRLEEFFSDVSVTTVDGVGHFTPLECPHEFAELVRSRLSVR
jgi:pimeloyl-ACP methyl ester carboxylesterase